jgi:predicted permease
MPSGFIRNFIYAFLSAWFGNMLCYAIANITGNWDSAYVNPKNHMSIDWKLIAYISFVILLIASILYWVIMKLVFNGKVYFYALFGMVLFFLAVSVLGMPACPGNMKASMLIMVVITAFSIFYFVPKTEIGE